MRGLSRAGRRARRRQGRTAGGHDRSSAPKRSRPLQQQNAQCLACHQSNAAHDWASSAHAASDVACASCHTAACAERSGADGGDPDRGLHQLSSSAAHGSVQAFASSAARRQDGLHLLPFAAWLDGAGAAREEHRQRNLHRLSRRIPRTVPVGTPAGRGGLHQLSRSARLGAAGAAQDCARRFSARPVTRARAIRRSSTRRRDCRAADAERVPARRRLHQLSLADPRLESSVGSRIHAVGAHHEIHLSVLSRMADCGNSCCIRSCGRVGRSAERGHERLEVHAMSLPAGLHGRGGSRRARRQRRERELWTLHGHRSRRCVCRCLGVRAISQRRRLLCEL